MSELDTKKPNNQDDLADVKSLIGNADGGDFELDAILAEYGVAPNDGHGAVPVEEFDDEPGNVVAFPGVPFSDGEEDKEELPDEEPGLSEESPEEEDEPLPEDDLPDDPMPPRPPAEVIPFPQAAAQEEPADEDEGSGVISSFIKGLERKADDYADRMYEEDERIDPEEVRRLEQLIPGTDVEQEPEPPTRHKKEKKVEPPPPDTPPQELAREYTKGLKSARLRLNVLFVLCLLSIVQLIVPALGYMFVAPIGDPMVQSWFAAGLMGVGILLGYDAVFAGFHLFELDPADPVSMENLTAVAAELSKGDTVYYAGHCTGDWAFEVLRGMMGERMQPMRAGSVVQI